MFALLGGGRANVCHVVLESLGVQQSPRLVHDRHNHLLRKDVSQLDAVAVLAAHQLLLVLVVVGGRQQFAEDHLWNPDLVLGVLRDINRLSVVLNGKGCGRAGDLNRLDGILGVLLTQADGVVVGVHQQLVHQLVETRVNGNCGCLEVLSIANEHLLGASHNAAHVGVGKVKDVLAVRLALVGRECHGGILFGGPQSFRFQRQWRTRLDSLALQDRRERSTECKEQREGKVTGVLWAKRVQRVRRGGQVRRALPMALWGLGFTTQIPASSRVQW